jgi:hypothetical protein
VDLDNQRHLTAASVCAGLISHTEIALRVSRVQMSWKQSQEVSSESRTVSRLQMSQQRPQLHAAPQQKRRRSPLHPVNSLHISGRSSQQSRVAVLRHLQRHCMPLSRQEMTARLQSRLPAEG